MAPDSPVLLLHEIPPHAPAMSTKTPHFISLLPKLAAFKFQFPHDVLISGHEPEIPA
jgi:hypothetical protein